MLARRSPSAHDTLLGTKENLCRTVRASGIKKWLQNRSHLRYFIAGVVVVALAAAFAVLNTQIALARLVYPLEGVIRSPEGISVEIQSSPPTLADGQFVWGPNVGNFDIRGFLEKRGSLLAPYAADIESWARYATINPRVLLAVLELNYGYITRFDTSLDPAVVRQTIEEASADLSLAFYQHLYNVGSRQERGVQLFAQAVPEFEFEDGVKADLIWTPTSGTYAVAALAAKGHLQGAGASIQALGGSEDFDTVFGYFFPDTDPLDASNDLEPDSPPPDDFFQFPFPLDATWTFSGAHSWSGGSSYPDRSSMDFSTPWSNYPNSPYKNTVAAAPGDAVVRVPASGRAPCWVEIDHGGGWTTHYYHLVNIGASGPIGPKSQNQLIGGIGVELCNGGFATGPHVHFALFYNGAPYDLEGLKLSGWTVHEGPRTENAYNTGSLERDGVSISPWNWILNDYLSYYGSGNSGSLYFQGHDESSVDRLKIPIDDPARSNPGPIMDLGFHDFVLEWWMKANPGDNTAPIVTCGANTDWKAGNILFDRSRSNGGTQWGVSIANGRVVFGVTNSTNQSRTICSTTAVDDGAWHHVAVQRNRFDSTTGEYADGQLWLFVDGVLEATIVGPVGDISYPDSAPPGATCGATGNQTCKDDSYLVVGGAKNNQGLAFKGWLDDIRGSAWLRYLASFTPPTAPHAKDNLTIALYRLDSGSSNVAFDTGGYDGGTSNGWLYFGGSPTGPVWSSENPFGVINPTSTPTPTATGPTPTPTPTNTPTPTPTATPPAQGRTTWFLAEGFTGAGFSTFILVQNPNPTPADVTVTYMLDDGTNLTRLHTVPANSRYTIAAHDPAEVGPDQAFATRLDSDQPVIVERAMYWPDDGHDTIGLTGASDTWFLAEGFTGAGFSTFILVQNPNPTPADVTVTYMLDDGTNLTRLHTVPANSRYTIAAHDPAEVGPDQAFATRLDSDQPVIVERAMYWAGGGHDTIGLTSASDTWFLAEGFTGAGFSTFILVQNPNPTPADVTVTYMLDDGTNLTRLHTVPANSRYTIAAHDPAEVGPDQAFATRLDSDQPVIVERAMYWADGGHDTIGLTGASSTWFLAEGFTGAGFSTFILVQNPNPTPADVTVTYMLDDGTNLTRLHTVPANSRYTIAAHDPAEVGPDQAFATRLDSDQPVIVERAMYWAGGGHGTVGFTP